MGIIRSPRPETNFYQLDKSISEDSRLSWAARGMLIFLLGKPDDWEVSVAHLIKQTTKTAKHSGRDAVYGLLAELEVAGYVRKQPRRSDGEAPKSKECKKKIKRGAFCGVDYLVSEAGAPTTSPPLSDLPDAVQPDTANPTQISIDYNQRLKKKQKPKKIPAPAPPPPAQKYIARLAPSVTPEQRSTKNVVERI